MSNCLKDDYYLTECILPILGEEATKKSRKFIPCEERTPMDIPSSPQSRSLAHSGSRSPSESLSNGQRSFSPSQESLSESLSQRQRGGSSGSSTHGRRSFSPGQESLSESLSQRQRGGSSGSSTHGRSYSRRSRFKPLLQKRGWTSSESFSWLQNASEPTRSSKSMQPIFSISDTPRTTIDRSLRKPPEKSMRAERDPPNAAEAMSTHAHSNKLRNEDFPMSEKKFQKRVLQLLLEIKDTIHIATSSAGTSYEVKPANTEEELEALENCLEDKNEGAELTMTNKMMAKMSLRGRSGKVAFMKTHLYKTICDAVFSSFNTTMTKVEEYMSKYLKYAPERMGGGGRKK
ncbi:uro-adherence factor A-like isoform X2 [Epinephelus fuscoguttatus]|uniref:uro-adherence factor A-like isoform X2 n=1 Tax=Epinephelus fuscoguttatus TaxID=293821 RepID=UPI0020CFF8E7|nr:uro-adherence factor A-like isoform X2 [Epinephelus fuscoguttatus]